MNWMDVGRFLIIAGTVVIVVGVLFLMADKFPVGRLPGDIHFGAGRIKIYVPIATCILLSIVITLVVNFFSRK
jgi:Zn-dependent protease with chaperone function